MSSVRFGVTSEGETGLAKDRGDRDRYVCLRSGLSTGTAGWIRTTDLLIHNQYQVVDFPRVCPKRYGKAQ
jgi:hypothetical protein